MEKFTWTSEYETGIGVIDAQHRDLFKKFDNFSLALYNGEGKNHLREIISFLDTYIQEHFEEEEALMSANNYPDYHRHVEMHRKFSAVFTSFKKDFEKRGGDTYMALQLEREIRGWWNNHILNADRQYVPFIKLG